MDRFITTLVLCAGASISAGIWYGISDTLGFHLLPFIFVAAVAGAAIGLFFVTLFPKLW